MRRLALAISTAILAVAALPAAAQFAAPAARQASPQLASSGKPGLIKICRQPGAADSFSGKTLEIASGLQMHAMAEIGRQPNGTAYPQAVRTIQLTRIPANASCATVKAEIDPATAQTQRATVADHLIYLPATSGRYNVTGEIVGDID